MHQPLLFAESTRSRDARGEGTPVDALVVKDGTARPASSSVTGHQYTPAGAARCGASEVDGSSGSLNPAGAFHLARRDDPQTSKEAAERVREFAARHHELIVGALKKRGPMTYEEIALATDLEPVAVGRRLNELASKQRIDADGVRPTSKGRNATVWRLRK